MTGRHLCFRADRRASSEPASYEVDEFRAPHALRMPDHKEAEVVGPRSPTGSLPPPEPFVPAGNGVALGRYLPHAPIQRDRDILEHRAK
jgi:hypothetical protein